MAAARWVVLFLAVSAAWARDEWRPGGGGGAPCGQVLEKERRRVVAASDAGAVTAVDVADAAGSVYRLQFITMNPGALFLPVQLHADMVFYVHSGRGKVTYIEEGSSETASLEVERGDVYNLEQGTILYIQSYPCATRERLRIYAVFSSDGIDADDPSNPRSKAYSSIGCLLKGFDTEVLRLGFGVPREVVEAIRSAQSPPLIVPYNPEDEEGELEESSSWREEVLDAVLGVRDPNFLNKKKKGKGKEKHKDKDKKDKSKAFNFFSGKPDVENCYGWSRTMTNEDLQSLHGTNIGMFMVNLTTGAMMGPHWNPKATEIAVVTEGGGIVQTVCPSNPSGGESTRSHRHRRQHGGDHGGEGGDEGERCRSSVLRVKEGDVFVVPRFHPMAQISFNNGSFVFVGFSTDMGRNHPQFLAGGGSVLRIVGKEILARSLGQRNSTAVEWLLSAQRGSTILACTSCAEELARKAEQQQEGEGEREEEEERKRREEEKERKRREEEERERREREEERKQREREEQRRREEEERARKKQEEEERRRREEEEEERARREQEEEERRRREEEEEEGGGGWGGGDEPRREEEEGEWGETRYQLSTNLRKRFRAPRSSSGGRFTIA